MHPIPGSQVSILSPGLLVSLCGEPVCVGFAVARFYLVQYWSGHASYLHFISLSLRLPQSEHVGGRSSSQYEATT
ncbi:hypothetical protein H6F88_29315 [Oculatella sp. FACHB-28]|uniref:hypothetical protein n=1 Tax=Cyanophyceae TaxID=3028117 RepID=UPI0016828165|nr:MULTISPECIES: hypothetical protein [Cyanophyceae]MBD1866879.1 hypothetical protein [Cyanobacteria bacterium FACHB-471]MBD1999782.1 hypothetical protein [Leptolyngbya sp. FACHB-541]MBD2060045.1 hypothetical protein [Oculatella sp. FACHB-28]MBD2068780.1 hypothetical protein [Leptolyngbya sp. FACHB-671]